MYEVLTDRVAAGTATPTPHTSSSSPSTSSSSCHTSTELYSEIPSLSTTASPARSAALDTLPSFYDVIRPHGDPGEGVTSEEGEEGESEEIGDDDTTTQPKSGEGNLYEFTQPQSCHESNLYESVKDPFSSLDGSGEYSTLERRRGYATLEPYTGTGTLRMKQLKKEDEEEQGKEDEQYAHLYH